MIEEDAVEEEVVEDEDDDQDVVDMEVEAEAVHWDYNQFASERSLAQDKIKQSKLLTLIVTLMEHKPNVQQSWADKEKGKRGLVASDFNPFRAHTMERFFQKVRKGFLNFCG